MRAIVCDGVGEANVMRMATVEIPAPASTGAPQVLIHVKAAGINRPDLLQRAGLYAPPADASPLLGLEVAGEIIQINGATDWAIGDAVCALTHGGGYAEYVWADARHCLPIPTGWTMAQAASVPETLFTVWLNVFDRAHLGRDGAETLLVHAGASGIGVAAIQMAKALGNRVIVTLRQMSKAQVCQDLGADEVIELNDDWAQTVLDKTAGKGVNVILDMLGTATAAGDMKALAHGGRLAWIAFLTGSKVEIKVHEVMGKQAQLTGAFLRPQSVNVKAKIAQDIRTHILPHLNSGAIQPAVDKVFDMTDVVQAHEYMASNQHTGKLVLSWE
ncbi:MAG: ppsC [Burkholderiaceae bacterium]|nr:ppsC [Burkholderiaceae bacterium]